MKKIRFVKALFAAAALILAIPGCSNLDGTDSAGVQKQADKIALNISAGSGYARTALPGDIDLATGNYYFTLESVKSGETTIDLLAKDFTYSELIGAKTIYVEPGTYSFTLNVLDDLGKVLAGTLSDVTISAENNALAFKLFAVKKATATGSVNITVTVPQGYGVTNVVATNIDGDTKTDLTVTLTKDNDENVTGATITGNVPAGASTVLISAFDEEPTDTSNPVGLFREPVYAVKGITSSDNLTIEILSYKATVNVTTDDTTAPVVTLKNKGVTGAADITLTTTSTASPFVYTGSVPYGAYDVYVGSDAHGSVTNASAVAVDTRVTLESISAAWTGGSQPTFYAGTTEAQILAALTVTGSYKDADNKTSTAEIASGYTLTGYDSTKTTAQTVTVSYSGKTDTIEVTLTPIAVATIAIKANPTKTTYKLGEALDLTGLIITPTMNNDTTGDDVAYSATTADDFAATGFDSSSVAASKTVTVTYKETATATASFSAKIIGLSGIELTTPPTKTTGYTSTDTELDLTGMVVTATYTDDVDTGLYPTDVTDKVTLSTPDFTQSGEQTITVTYKEGSGDLEQTETTSFKIWVTHAYAEKMTLDFTGSTPAGKAWNGVPIRGKESGNVAALVTRTEGSYAGYLGRKFWLVDGVYAEYCNSSAGLGYTNSEKDTTHTSTDLVKAIESEPIQGPFKLTIKTNDKDRVFKIFIAADKAALWAPEAVAVVEEKLGAHGGVHTVEYVGTGSACIGLATEPASDKTVYTSISSIELETDTAIPADTFPATGIAFTNSEIDEGKLSLTKDALATAGTEGFALTAEVTPSYAADKTYSFAYETAAQTSHISVSEAGVITISEADSMTENETGTITVTAKGGTDVKASIELTVVARVDDATKIATTKTELETAFGTGTTFVYGSVAKAKENADAFINALTLTYKDDVKIVSSVDEATGKLTITVSIEGSSAERATVEYAYTEAMAQAAVAAAVEEIKTLTDALNWNKDAATTVLTINSAIELNVTAGSLKLTDATAAAAVSATDSDTVVVTVASKVISTVKDETITLEAPKFEIVTEDSKSYLNLLAKSYAYYLSKENLQAKTGDNAWSAVATDNWGDKTGTLVFTDKISAYNMSETSRTITLNVKGVYSADLYVYNNTEGRKFTVKVGSGEAKEFTHKGTGDEKFTIETKTADAITITIAGGGSSVYPIGIVLYAPEGESTSLDVNTELPLEDITLSSTGNTFTVSGAPVLASGAGITWYVDDVVQTGSTAAEFTLPATSTVGVTYEVRVDVTVNGITYSQSESVMYQ